MRTTKRCSDNINIKSGLFNKSGLISGTTTSSQTSAGSLTGLDIPEGSFCGRGRHKDKSTLGLSFIYFFSFVL